MRRVLIVWMQPAWIFAGIIHVSGAVGWLWAACGCRWCICFARGGRGFRCVCGGAVGFAVGVCCLGWLHDRVVERCLWCGVLLVWVGGFSGCPRALFSGPGALGGSWSLGCAALSCRRGARASALWHNIPNQFLLFSGGVFLLGLAGVSVLWRVFLAWRGRVFVACAGGWALDRLCVS